jgi:hypothetical protein
MRPLDEEPECLTWPQKIAPTSKSTRNPQRSSGACIYLYLVARKALGVIEVSTDVTLSSVAERRRIMAKLGSDGTANLQRSVRSRQTASQVDLTEELR